MSEITKQPERAYKRKVVTIVAGIGFIALAGLILLRSDDQKKIERVHSVENQERELADRSYSIFTEPLHTKPKEVGKLDKIDNPIKPVCVVESATLAVDSILVHSYVKGLGVPVVSLVADYEFPELHATTFVTGFPECTEQDLAMINADSALPR